MLNFSEFERTEFLHYMKMKCQDLNTAPAGIDSSIYHGSASQQADAIVDFYLNNQVLAQVDVQPDQIQFSGQLSALMRTLLPEFSGEL